MGPVVVFWAALQFSAAHVQEETSFSGADVQTDWTQSGMTPNEPRGLPAEQRMF